MSRFKSKSGIYLFGKVRRTDWLPVRETAKAMEQDQVDRSEESMSDYNSEEEEAMVMPRDYKGDYADSISGDSDDSCKSHYVSDRFFSGRKKGADRSGLKDLGGD